MLNGLWPKTANLYKWIHSTWTDECEISLCSKGFFMVFFHHSEDHHGVFKLGPWFWGREGLFITPWVVYFDPNKTLVTKTLVWIRLIDLPLHFWITRSLEAIGNSIVKFLKIDIDREKSGLATYSRICVEAYLSKGLPEKILFIWKDSTWAVQLDYENTTF